MFCPNCGKEIREGTAFCSNCGQKINIVNDLSNHDIENNDTPYENSVISLVNQQKESATYNQSAQSANRNKKIFWISILIIVSILLFIVLLPLLNNETNEGNGIEITEEKLFTDALSAIIGNNLYPILEIKVKNVSSITKKVSFEANFYADGNLLGSDISNIITLMPGDEAYIFAQSDKGYPAWTSHEYSYKITKWNVFDQ